MNLARPLLLIAITTLLSAPASADPSQDQLIEGAKLCTHFLPHYERQYGIPAHLLSAIASTESGRYHQGLKLSLPWPWTINAEGKGYFFDTKEQAIAAARKLRANGIKSMDVGCMQVNLYHHAEAFATLEQAFEPEANIAYAASFLRTLYQESSSWKKAASDYHSKTTSLGAQYFVSVYDRWRSLVTRLREAKLQSGNPTEMAANTPSEQPEATPPVSAPYGSKLQFTQAQLAAQQAANIEPQVSATPQSTLAQTTRPAKSSNKLQAQRPVHMNSIRVSTVQAKRESGVMVIRPEIKLSEAPMPAPQERSSGFVLANAEQPQAHVVRLDNAVVASDVAPKKTGPNFIFDQ